MGVTIIFILSLLAISSSYVLFHESSVLYNVYPKQGAIYSKSILDRHCSTARADKISVFCFFLHTVKYIPGDSTGISAVTGATTCLETLEEPADMRHPQISIQLRADAAAGICFFVEIHNLTHFIFNSALIYKLRKHLCRSCHMQRKYS